MKIIILILISQLTWAEWPIVLSGGISDSESIAESNDQSDAATASPQKGTADSKNKGGRKKARSKKNQRPADSSERIVIELEQIHFLTTLFDRTNNGKVQILMVATSISALLFRAIKTGSLRALAASTPALILLPPQMVEEFVGTFEYIIAGDKDTYFVPEHPSVKLEDIQEFLALSRELQEATLRNDIEFATYLSTVVRSLQGQEYLACIRKQLCS